MSFVGERSRQETSDSEDLPKKECLNVERTEMTASQLTELTVGEELEELAGAWSEWMSTFSKRISLGMTLFCLTVVLVLVKIMFLQPGVWYQIIVTTLSLMRDSDVLF